MTRFNKIQELQRHGVYIVSHFNKYSKQRRLIIDEVEDFKYNKTAEEQRLAGEHVDLLYWEYTRE